MKNKKEQISWFINKQNDANKLIEGIEMLAEDSLENMAEDKLSMNDIPLWKHFKMNYKAWTAAGKACVNWLKINDTNRKNENYSMAIQAISLQLQWAMEDINCLKKCMAESNNGCIKECSR